MTTLEKEQLEKYKELRRELEFQTSLADAGDFDRVSVSAEQARTLLGLVYSRLYELQEKERRKNVTPYRARRIIAIFLDTAVPFEWDTPGHPVLKYGHFVYGISDGFIYDRKTINKTVCLDEMMDLINQACDYWIGRGILVTKYQGYKDEIARISKQRNGEKQNDQT